MKFLSVLLMLGGYMLVYAAVAKSGRFATEPWEGLFHDAYDETQSGQQQQQTTPQPSPAPTPRPPIRTNRGFRTP